jgi:hypothetical protein
MMSNDDLIRRGDARRAMLAYASSYSAEEAETAIAALPAAQTFTAADLEAACRIGLAMAEARAVFCGLSPDTGKSSYVARAIAAMEPPPDLARRVEEARKQRKVKQ